MGRDTVSLMRIHSVDINGNSHYIGVEYLPLDDFMGENRFKVLIDFLCANHPIYTIPA